MAAIVRVGYGCCVRLNNDVRAAVGNGEENKRIRE